MKKSWMLLLLALMALVTMLAFGAAAETQLPEQCPHCKTAVTWKPLSEVAATTIPAGHYYVDAETVTVTNKTVAKSTQVCIYMNGNTIDAGEVNRVFYVSGTLSVMGEGTVKGYGRNKSMTSTSDRYGGTVHIPSSGVFNLYDATVTSEKLTDSKASNGGNINIFGVFNMYSGTVSNGYASNCGGNIFVNPAGIFNMYGGSVTGGTCSTGKSVCAQGKITLAGDASINNLYLWNKTLSFEQILIVEGIYTGTTYVQLRSTTPAADMVVGTSDNANVRRASFDFAGSGLYVKVDGTQLKLTTEDPSIVKQECAYCKETVTWSPLTEDNAADTSITAGHYYLDFLDGAATWTPKSISGKVCLELNGMTVTGGTRAFVVKNGGVLSIQGNGTVIGHGTDSTGSNSDRVGGTILVSSGGTLNLYSGTLTFQAVDGMSASNGGVVCTYGVFNMYGGTVRDGKASNAGTNVFVTPAGAFNMYGGAVTTNTGKPVYCQGSLLLAGDAQLSKVYMFSKETGPAITDMLTVQGTYTGNVQLEYRDFTLEKGTVVGISDGADLRHAGITVEGTTLFVTAEDNVLKLTDTLPVFTKEAFCSVCNKTVTWTGLMESFAGQTNIESGHYYLEFGNGSGLWDSKIISGKVCLDLNGQTLTGKTRAFVVESGSVLNLIGEGTVVGRGKSSSLEIADKTAGTILVEGGATVNQYGGKLTYEKVSSQNAGNGGILNVAGTYNLYDGSVENGQSVWVGGNIFVTTTGKFHMYGGKVVGGTASQAGNSVACRGEVLLSGDASINELYLYPNTADGGPALSEMLTVEGKYTGTVKLRVSGIKAGIDVGTAINTDFTGATVTSNSSSVGGFAAHGKDLLLMGSNTVIHMEGTAVLGSYGTFEDAMAAYTGNTQKLVLMANVENIVLTKDVYVDLNGHNITGTVTGTGTLFCMDAHTDDLTVADGVYGTAPASANVQPVSKGAPCTTYGYLMITENGKASFHRIKMLVTAVNLRPSAAGLYYSCSFGGDEMVKNLVKSFGMLVSIEGDPIALNPNAVVGTTAMTADLFGANTASTSTLISGIMKAGNSTDTNNTNAQTAIYGRTYVELTDGTVLYGECIEKSLYDQVCGTTDMVGIERMWDGLTVPQKRTVMDMYEAFADTVSGWNTPTISGAVAVRDDAAEDILLARREIAMAKMRQMGDLYWRATEDVKFRISATGRWVEFKTGRIYRGIPYTHARSDENTFLEFAGAPDSKGIYNISGLAPEHMQNGSTYARIGNDCSGSVTFAWSAAGADIAGTNSSRYMIEANGYYKVGDYEYTPTEDGRIGISKDIVKANGKERMFEAYAKVQGGDALDTTTAAGGHVILVMGKHVVYNADGTINGDLSYIHTLEQTPGPVSITVQKRSWNEELQEIVYDIYIEKNLTFNQCFSSGYLPITVKVLTDATASTELKIQDSLSAEEHSFENLLKGSIASTRIISSVTLTVTDDNGEVFSIRGSGIRASIRTFYMKNFLTEDPAVMRGSMDLTKLIPGNDYHCTVTVQVASGDIVTVRDFDFTATDADISTPESTETPEETEPEEEEIPDETTEN